MKNHKPVKLDKINEESLNESINKENGENIESKGKSGNIWNKLEKFINSWYFVLFIGLLILAKTFLFYYHTIAVNEQLYSDTIIGTISFVVVIICFLFVLPNRARVVTSMVVDFIISFVLFGDNIYYNYSNSVLSIAQITNLQYGGEIMSTLPMVLKLYQILYFLDIIVLVILLIAKKVKIYKKGKKTKKQLIGKWIVGIIGVVIFCIIGVDYVEKGKEKSYNKDQQIREATIFGYHIYDIENIITMKKQTKYKEKEEMMADYEELKEEYDEEYGLEKYSALKGILEGKNVIILQLESVQEYVINKQLNGQEITPNLNKFINENIEFSNMNMQSYSTTADSEFSTITSLYPMENGMSFAKYYTNTYNTIFDNFNNAGYDTSYMHGNYAYFWNRGNVYSRMNLDHLELKDQFEDTSENINEYLSDELLYRQAVEKLSQYDQPFFTYIVAASSHTPFTLEGLQDRSKINIDVGKYKYSFLGNYLEAVNYADYAFGVFIDELKKAGLYDDTAILVFGDHNGLSMYDEQMLDFLAQTDSDLTDVDIKLSYTKVACGMRIPGVKNLTIEKPVTKLDIKPTFSYLCNIEDGFSLGTNMFASKDFVSLNNERIISSRYYYDEVWYDILTGQPVDFETLDEDTKELLERYERQMRTELEISNSISINNLLK